MIAKKIYDVSIHLINPLLLMSWIEFTIKNELKWVHLNVKYDKLIFIC